MNAVIRALQSAFASDAVPLDQDFVRFDGIDQLGKEYLREQLHGKSQEEVLALLEAGELGNGANCTEELELAEPRGLRYYLYPFLLHFATRVYADVRALDDEAPFFLFAHVRNIVEHRGASVFTDAQLAALGAFVADMQRLIATLSTDAIWVGDVSLELRKLDEALKSAAGPA